MSTEQDAAVAYAMRIRILRWTEPFGYSLPPELRQLGEFRLDRLVDHALYDAAWNLRQLSKPTLLRAGIE